MGQIYALILALIAISIAFFLYGRLRTLRQTPIGDIRVQVGDKMLPFSALTPDGVQFQSDELLGRRVLFKFFRGAWWPYCSAELQRFQEMEQDELAQYNISVVALSKDTPAEAALHAERDHLTLQLLSDVNLKVIRQYGVEHHKALRMEADTFKIFGVPLRLKRPSYQAMAIPTTLLIDEEGIIRWIDQADDYSVRSDNERVLSAVREVFGEPVSA